MPGKIVFDGQVMDDARPPSAPCKGIARTFQNIRLFPHLTVLETVMIGEHCRSYPSVCGALEQVRAAPPFGEAGEEREHAFERDRVARIPGARRITLDAKASDLPYGDQRKLELARALATRPRLLLLDEPAAGMNPRETEELDDIITRIRDRGITIILVEHDMDWSWASPIA